MYAEEERRENGFRVHPDRVDFCVLEIHALRMAFSENPEVVAMLKEFILPNRVDLDEAILSDALSSTGDSSRLGFIPAIEETEVYSTIAEAELVRLKRLAEAGTSLQCHEVSEHIAALEKVCSLFPPRFPKTETGAS